MTYQLEKCPETGRLHLQGVLQCARKGQRMQWVKNKLAEQTIHLEPKRGTWQQAIAYARKEETRVLGPWTLGEEPAQGKRSELEAAKALLDSGADERKVAEECFGAWVRHYKAFERYRALKSGQPRNGQDAIEVVALIGEPGHGKSHWVRNVGVPYGLAKGLRGVYSKSANNKWWDDYMGEQIIILDDFSGAWFQWTTLMQVLDKYPCRVEKKGASTHMCGRLILITSNVDPMQWYAGKPVSALERRITHRAVVHNRKLTWTKGSEIKAPEGPILLDDDDDSSSTLEDVPEPEPGKGEATTAQLIEWQKQLGIWSPPKAGLPPWAETAAAGMAEGDDVEEEEHESFTEDLPWWLDGEADDE